MDGQFEIEVKYKHCITEREIFHAIKLVVLDKYMDNEEQYPPISIDDVCNKIHYELEKYGEKTPAQNWEIDRYEFAFFNLEFKEKFQYLKADIYERFHKLKHFANKEI
jgi:hypothetical protein